MSGFYDSVLAATAATLKPLLATAPPGATPSQGWSVVRRTRPAWVPLQDSLPACVVAPNEALDEKVIKLLFDGEVVLGYEVYVGLFVDDRAEDPDQLERLLGARELVRDELWEPDVLGLRSLGEYDVTYFPDGPGGHPPPPNVRATWQLFRFDFKTTRSSGRGRIRREVR